MFDFQDLFQWDRFITPTIIKTFYWLVIALICLFGLSGIFSGLALMAISPFSASRTSESASEPFATIWRAASRLNLPAKIDNRRKTARSASDSRL